MSDRDQMGSSSEPIGSPEPIGYREGTSTPSWATEVGEPVDAGASTFGTDAPVFEETTGTGGTMTGTGSSGGSTADKAKDVAGQAQQKAGAAVETAKQKTDQVTDQAATKVDAGIDRAAEGLDKLADTIRGRAESSGQGGASPMLSRATMVADKLDVTAQYLRGKDTDQLITDLEALVRRKPTQSMLVAAGVGFLLSKTLR